MTRSRPLTTGEWRRVNDVFHLALALPSERRSAVLDETCGDNPALREEVASLLAAHDRAGDFIEAPAASPPAGAGAAADAERLVGRQLGQYRIERILGEGGMGVVYLAEDIRLGRTVALKALPPSYTGDPVRRERLRREARAAAALTHPGIATVYALEEFEGLMFIAGEYVPGETLREELKRGPLGAARALDTALAIARALAAAHDRGIVHRDLKPENIIRTPADDVKVLDFGLAHVHDLPASLAHLSGDGTVLGTPAYMSPEQIRGQAVDSRSDLFAFGIMVYELSAGVHPFAGPDAAATIARILEADPARLADLTPTARWPRPALDELEDLVGACLNKSADLRYRSAHDLVGAIERARAASMGGAPLDIAGPRTPRPPSRRKAAWWWQFHQAAASAGYGLLVVPLWTAHGAIGGPAGLPLFVAGLLAAIVAAVLRLHAWFAWRAYPDEWARQRQRTARWTRAADVVFVLALAAGGVAATAVNRGGLGVFLVAAAAVVFVVFTVIEPATARAAGVNIK